MAGKGRFKDLTGLRFGRLKVVSRGENLRYKARWNAVCDCGNTSLPFTSDLISGHTTSCGCVQIERTVARSTTHGMNGKTPEHTSWAGMIARCHNPNDPKYYRYGGRGIAVCDKWREFVNFYTDMGPRPSEYHTVERKDNNVGYSPENCVWATPKDQARNRRTTVFATYMSQTLPLIEWCEKLNVPYETVRQRVQRLKWDIEKALTTPIKAQNRST